MTTLITGHDLKHRIAGGCSPLPISTPRAPWSSGRPRPVWRATVPLRHERW